MISKNLAYFFVFPDMFCTFAPMETKNENIYLSDQEIVDLLLNGNEDDFDEFFKREFQEIAEIVINKIFTEETSNESVKAWALDTLLEYFKANDAIVLREYNENKGPLKKWLTRKAIGYFQDARRISIEQERKTSIEHEKLLRKKEEKEKVITHNGKKSRLSPPSPPTPLYELEYKEVMEKAKRIIAEMEENNKEYAEIMRRLVIEENYDPRTFSIEWGIPYNNLAEDKKRAITAFLKLYFPKNYKEIIKQYKKKRK